MQHSQAVANKLAYHRFPCGRYAFPTRTCCFCDLNPWCSRALLPGVSIGYNGDSSKGGCCHQRRLCSGDNAPGGSDGVPAEQPSPPRRSLFGADAAPMPEVPKVVAIGSGAMPVRSTKSVPFSRLRLSSERVTKAKARATAQRVYRSAADVRRACSLLGLRAFIYIYIYIRRSQYYYSLYSGT